MNIKELRVKQFHGQNGFTLTEVILVIVIIGALAAVAIPNFLSWLPGMRLKAASRDILSKMQEARMLAIKDNRNYVIVFDVANNLYTIRDDSGPDHIPKNNDTAAENDGTYSNAEILETVVLTTYGSGVTYGSGPATEDVPGNAAPFGSVSYAATAACGGLPNVVFNSSGTSGPGSGYVYLTNQNNNDSFAIGSLVSGSIRLLRWSGGGGNKWQ